MGRRAQRQQQGRAARGVALPARRAWPKAERSCDAAVHTAGVIRRVALALAVCRPDGPLHEWRAATKPLTGPEWGKVRRWRREARPLQ